MRFVVVSRTAADSLASDRFLQSVEFDQGLKLAALLQGDLAALPDMPRVTAVPGKEGVAFVTRKDESPDALVFDLEASGLFASLEPNEALLVFQKTLRFALRNWSSQKLTASERMIRGTSKAVVFPFPISTQTLFRVVIECAPDDKRLAKRPHAGKCLLVFRSGTTDGLGAGEEAEVTVFRKALAVLQEARATVTATPPVESPAPITTIGLTRLAVLPNLIDGHIGFEAWERNLTAAQRAFVMPPLVGPHRIEGPAGSGKTVCLVLKAINTLREAHRTGAEHRALFVAHSDATRAAIQSLFEANDSDAFATRDPYSSAQSVRVTTLHQLCGDLLGHDISAAEFLDRDALESKNVQLLYVEEALSQTLTQELETHRPFLSRELVELLGREDKWALAQMLQHEISVIIKGRAEENLEKYKRVRRTPTGLPLANESDRGFLFIVFQRYQEQLRAAAAFDTDDVVLSAMGQLNTPIWRRRRAREGYDSLFVDETHLFNLNELSVFHHLTRSDRSFPIAYSTDPSQSLQDRGWTDELFDAALGDHETSSTPPTRVRTVFRCSSDIVNLALSVASSGATLFANFDNSVREATSAFTEGDERQCVPPQYISCPNDDTLVQAAFTRAESMAQAVEGGRSKVAIVVFDEMLWGQVRRLVSEANKPVEILTRRGDIEVVRRAQRAGRFVLCTPDYVGGLEFSGVVLVGVDQGRVPPSELLANTGSAAFLSFQAHSRLYVAITRARYRVEILGSAERGPSALLKSAIQSKSIEERML